jgi:RNA polymerase sigma-70 factor (ECF subfamily)
VGRLTVAYHAAQPGVGPSAPCADVGALESVLSELCARGQAAHPDLGVSEEAFVTHLARCGALVSGAEASVHAEDLYLASACLRGEDAAIAFLVGTHKQMLVITLSRIDHSPAFVDDVQQRFWDATLVGTMSAPPRLAAYSGHGALAGWVAVAAQRVALMMRRHEDAEGRARHTAEDADAAQWDPELAFIKERYRERFQAATQKALEILDDRERMIFRLHLVDGLTIERIGRVYGVSHSTISRWFGSARDKVVEEVQRIIREELEISPADFESLKRLVISQLDVSLSMLPPAGP